MNTVSLEDLPLYPGRGLLAGRLPDATPVVIYFVTGRSTASKDRFARQEPDRIVIAPRSGHPGDPLGHYTCLRRSSTWTVAGNGDHVDAIFDAVTAGGEFFTSLTLLTYEPDEPICTPRIVVALRQQRAELSVVVGSARPGPDITVEHRCLASKAVPRGSAVAACTYVSDGESIEPDGLPRWVRLEETIERTAEVVWAALNPRFRVLLVATFIEDPSRTIVLSQQPS